MNSKLREINKILYNVKLIDCDHCDGLGMVPSDYTTAGQQFDKCKICNGYGTQEKARKVLADDLLALFERQLVEKRDLAEVSTDKLVTMQLKLLDAVNSSGVSVTFKGETDDWAISLTKEETWNG